MDANELRRFEEETEEWQPISEYEGMYEVSNWGRIRTHQPRFRHPRILCPVISRYPRITLTKNGCHHRYMVHRLVGAASLGPLPMGYQVHHLDSNRRNNRATNLIYLPMTLNLGLPHKGKGRKKLAGKPICCLSIPQSEEWRGVVGYEELYEVSSEGQIRIDSHPYHKSKTGRLLEYRIRNGYRSVGLTKKGRRRDFKVALLVAQAFIGQRPKGWFLNHIDGNKENDRLENLEYVTPSHNKRHALRLGLGIRGLFQAGENHRNVKLTRETVLSILRSNASAASLARVHGVSPSNISMIRNRRAWTHIGV